MFAGGSCSRLLFHVLRRTSRERDRQTHGRLNKNGTLKSSVDPTSRTRLLRSLSAKNNANSHSKNDRSALSIAENEVVFDNGVRRDSQNGAKSNPSARALGPFFFSRSFSSSFHSSAFSGGLKQKHHDRVAIAILVFPRSIVFTRRRRRKKRPLFSSSSTSRRDVSRVTILSFFFFPFFLTD